MGERKKPVRFRKRLSLLVALVLSLLIAFIIVKKSGMLSNRLNLYVNEHYLKDSDFKFACREVKGDLVSNVVLKDVVLRYGGKAGNFDLFRAKTITVNYSIFEVLKLNLLVKHLTIDDPQLRLLRDDDGALILPAVRTADSRDGSGSAPNIDIKKYVINNFEFLYRDSSRTVELEKINLAGDVRLHGSDGHVEIEQGSAFIPETRTQLQSIRFSSSFIDDLISLDNLIIRLDRSYIMASGKYQGGAVRHLQFVFNPIDLQEISSLGLIPENSGEIGGNVIMTGTLDTLNIRGTVTGKASGLVFSGFSFAGRKTGGVIDFSDLEGTLFGSYITGKLHYRTGSGGGYSFAGTCRGLDISEGFISSGGIPETDLYGRVEMEYQRRRDRYTFHATLDSSFVHGFRARRLLFDGSYQAASGLTIIRAEFSNPGFTLSGTGTVAPSSDLDLIVKLQGDNLDYLWDYLSLPRVQSAVDVSGRVSGPADDVQINLNGSMENVSFLFADIDSGEIQAEIKHVPRNDLVARVDLRGEHITMMKRNFSNPHLLLEVGGGAVEAKDFSFSKGDTLLTTDFEIVPLGANQDILFKHVVVAMPAETWATRSLSRLHLRNGTAELDSLVLSSDKGSIRLAGTYDETDKRFNMHAEGHEVAVSIIRRSLGIPWRLEGSSRFSADMTGTAERSTWRVDFELGRGAIDSIAIDGLRFGARYDDSGYSLDHLLLSAGGDSLSATGWWRLRRSPLQLAKDANREDLMLSAPWSFRVESTHYPLAPLFEALDRKPPLYGAFTGSILIGGTPDDARISARGALTSLMKHSYRFPDLHFNLAYEDSLLDINSLTFDDGSSSGAIDGRLPLVFSPRGGFRLRDTAAFEINSRIESSDLSMLARYFDFVDLARGSLRSTINAHGSLHDPTFSGNIDFENCSLRLSGMEELYTRVNGRVTLRNKMMQLTSLEGRAGKKGSFRGTGFAEWASFKPVRYRVDITMEEFLLSSIHDFLSLQDGTITVSSLGSGEWPLTPVVTGKLDVKQATITKSLGTETGTPSPLTLPSERPSWLCNLEMVAPKKIFIKNPGLNMELGGNLLLKRDKSGLYLRGELNVLRGSYTLYNNKFTITDGLFNFSTATALRPEIDLNAFSVYRMGDEEHRIFLNLSWPADKKEPQVTLSSDTPGYSETDIWKMLGGTYVATNGTRSGSWDAAGTAQSIAGNYLEGVLNAQMHDLTIDVESRTLTGSGSSQRPEREMTIAIGKYLSEDLYLKYRQGLSISTQREVDIEYRIGTMVILRSEIIRHSGRRLLGKSLQGTDEINFDIKFRIEY